MPNGTEWARAPVPDAAPLAFAGIHAIDPSIFSKMTETGIFPITRTYLRLAGEGERILACRADGAYWQDVGSAEKLEEARNRAASQAGPEEVGECGP
jgi:NDP-sugar pyrophosphorylase family protein